MDNYLKIIATAYVAIITALTPTYGKDSWWAILVAVAGVIALVAPSVVPSRKNAVPPTR